MVITPLGFQGAFFCVLSVVCKIIYMKKSVRIISISIFFISLVVFSIFAEESTSKKAILNIASVQFEISPSIYESVESFDKKISGIVDRLFYSKHYDLVIFPEYTSVFVALIPYYECIRGSNTFTEAFSKLQLEHPNLIEMRDIFVRKSVFVREVMDSVFGELAAKYKTYIVAGTYFHGTTDSRENYRLTNRLVVYGPSGRVIYYQDKVFLTDFEKGIIGLSSGEIGKATGFKLNGARVAFTVCRDTFERVWSNRYMGYDLWIDIKANGTYFNDEERESFMKALPARLGECNVKYGVTTCLVGSFLDLFWEGESSFIVKKKGRLIFLKKANTYNRECIISERLVMDY